MPFFTYLLDIKERKHASTQLSALYCHISSPRLTDRHMMSAACAAPGTLLFDVLALSEPCGTALPIGSIWTTSSFASSQFGDQSLFFQHVVSCADQRAACRATTHTTNLPAHGRRHCTETGVGPVKV
mmetsp:Transcript_15630/g.54299  ORF Transcript_15630/g.54299 Transcript_15630/m.54299 type:complete len:127 (+) Transcript_15630:509-889(+)